MASVPDTAENTAKCICGQCPSYDDCMKGKMEGLFCAKGRSTCEVDLQGCAYGVCPITPELGLSKLYFCETGTE